MTVVERAKVDEGDLRRRELASFLRSRRDRLTPDDVGLPHIGRRRTPGLRREEVAQLAGVGVTWYTWLEQARDIHVSEQVLDAIARALLLDADERLHLFTLAGAPTTAAVQECKNVEPSMLAVLDQLDPFPALISNGRYDVIAHNRAYAGLMGDIGALGVPERNTLWLLFSCPQTRKLLIDWEERAATCVANFRAAQAEHVGEPAWKCLPRRLMEECEDFAPVWGRHDVGTMTSVTKSFDHPDLGVLKFVTNSLWLQARTQNRLGIYAPADDRTAELVGELLKVIPQKLDVPLR